MSKHRLMAHNSYGLIEDSIWIGLPKCATTSLYALWNNKNVKSQYFNENSDILKLDKSDKLKQIWCLWRNPWDRWLSALIQDYETELHLGKVTSGVKNQKELSDKDVQHIEKSLLKNWSFKYSKNIKNKKYPHSSIQLTRHIFLLWKLAQERFLCPVLTIYPMHEINNAVQVFTKVGYENITLNQTNKNNLIKLDNLFKSNNFYNQWLYQYKEDVNLHQLLNNEICRFHERQWLEKVSPTYGSRTNNFFKKLISEYQQKIRS